MTSPSSDFAPQQLTRVLATRANNRCSNPDCRAPTDDSQIDASGDSSTGVAAQIISVSPGSPRYDGMFTLNQFADMENVIWLCPSCAELIRNDPIRFNADVLRKWKESAELDAFAMQVLNNSSSPDPRLSRYRRFFKASRQPLASVEQRGMVRAVERWLDRHLTRSPPKLDVNWKDVESQTPEAIASEQAKTYAQAAVEFRTAPDGTVEAWLERKKLETAWFDSDEYRRAKRNSVFASFLSILITHTGLYPTKIPALGVEFPPLSKPAFLIFLLCGTWYLTLGMNMHLRGLLIDKALMEIAQARKGVLRDFTNRWSRFIDTMWLEKAMFDRRIPNLLCLYATVSIVVSIVRFFL